MAQIVMQRVDPEKENTRETPLLEGQIKGVSVYYLNMPAGETKIIPPNTNVLRVLFLLDGNISLRGDREEHIDRRGAIVPPPNRETVVTAVEKSQWLEIAWTLSDDDINFMEQSNLSFPLIFDYEKSDRYKESFKSEKTVSRSIIHHHVLPRFALGSVESSGFDRVEPHAHPLIDQFFFSFPENDAELIVDGEYTAFDGNILLHIPLGSDHGAQVSAGKRMHYLWIDFILNKQGIAYLDEVHIPLERQNS